MDIGDVRSAEQLLRYGRDVPRRTHLVRAVDDPVIRPVAPNDVAGRRQHRRKVGAAPGLAGFGLQEDRPRSCVGLRGGARTTDVGRAVEVTGMGVSQGPRQDGSEAGPARPGSCSLRSFRQRGFNALVGCATSAPTCLGHSSPDPPPRLGLGRAPFPGTACTNARASLTSPPGTTRAISGTAAEIGLTPTSRAGQVQAAALEQAEGKSGSNAPSRDRKFGVPVRGIPSRPQVKAPAVSGIQRLPKRRPGRALRIRARERKLACLGRGDGVLAARRCPVLAVFACKLPSCPCR